MTPDEKPIEEPGRPRFREGRSAFREETVPEETAPAEEHPPVGPAPGGPSAPAGESSLPPAEGAPPAEPSRAEPPAIEHPRPEPPVAEPHGGPEPPAPEREIITPSDEPAGELDVNALESFELPEPSFLEIVEILATQALQFLGDAPLTERGDRAVFPRHAKHVIDLLGILEERTRGNLPDEEREYLVALLDELRTRYLRVAP